MYNKNELLMYMKIRVLLKYTYLTINHFPIGGVKLQTDTHFRFFLTMFLLAVSLQNSNK